MKRIYAFNPSWTPIEELKAITCGKSRLATLDQIVLSLREEIGRPNHQHHLLIGPRGSGKTHLLRLLTVGRIPADLQLASAYLPVIMPEEIALRSPADLFLKFVERLAEQLKTPPAGISGDAASEARSLCLTALSTAKAVRVSKDRLEIMANCLGKAAKTLNRILLPVAENIDQTLYLGYQRSRKGPEEEHWALRRHLQQAPHLLLVAAAPSWFGAVGDPSKPFYDFFRCHNLDDLSADEMIEIIYRRLDEEAAHPGTDPMRVQRVSWLRSHRPKATAYMQGLLVLIGSLPRFAHLIYDVMIDGDITQVFNILNGFLDEITPYFQQRLDPRFMPQPEIDLLHALAMARGPQQPSELANLLFGVPNNEVSELLGRLEERGLVKRTGRPGGKAVTWDLNEPLFRVWVQFRDNPGGQEAILLLAEFVVCFYAPEEIKAEYKRIVNELTCLPLDDPNQHNLKLRQQLFGEAKKWIEKVEAITEEKRASEGLVAYTQEENFNKLLAEVMAGVNTGSLKENDIILDKLRTLVQQHEGEPVMREQLAKGLVNAINAAGKAQHLERVNALLDELRNLAQQYVDEPIVREVLVKGLVNAINAAGKAQDMDRVNALLDELRILAQQQEDEPAVREVLSMGLINAINAAGKAQDMDRVNALLNELRTLAQQHENEPAVREVLSMGLVNAINAAGEAQDLDRVNALLDELRTLARQYEDEPAVREWVSKGLVNATNAAGKAQDLDRVNVLLDELRTLARQHEDEPAVREWVSKGLVNATNAAGNAQDLDRVNALLDELRTLAQQHEDESAVREQLANGLFNVINTAGNAQDLDRVNALLDELRTLAQQHEDEPVVRKVLAKGLVNVAVNAQNVEHINALLDELRTLAQQYVDEPVVREMLAKGLFNAINAAVNAQDVERINALLEELRTLAQQYEDEPVVREVLAKGFFNAINAAVNAQDMDRANALLDELRTLAQQHEDEPVVREQLAKGLNNAINAAGDAHDIERVNALLDELRTLARQHTDEPVVQEALAVGLGITLDLKAGTGDLTGAKNIVRELLVLTDISSNESIFEMIKAAMMQYCSALLSQVKTGKIESVQEEFKWLWARLPEKLGALLRPIQLALDVMDNGEEQALARESEEVRRVVRIVLEKTKSSNGNR